MICFGQVVSDGGPCTATAGVSLSRGVSVVPDLLGFVSVSPGLIECQNAPHVRINGQCKYV